MTVSQARSIPRPESGLMIGAAIGSGIAALTAERGGADFLLAVNAGRMRNMGAPSIASMLPCHDATRLTEDFAAREVLPLCSVPVLLGINCWGESAEPAEIVERIAGLGFAGAVNFPNATLMSPAMQEVLRASGRGFDREIEILRGCQEAGLTSLYYSCSREDARVAAEAGIDMILLNFGWNVGGASGHKKRASLEEVAVLARDHAKVIRAINPRARILLEGGPIITADDLGYVAQVSAIDGYVGGSTLDRLPYEESVLNRIAGYRYATERQETLDRRQNALLHWGRRCGFRGRSPALLALLRQLETLAETARPVALAVEPGTPLQPLVSALARDEAATAEVDVRAAAFPAQVGQRLFGREGREGGEAGLLTSPGVSAVVLRHAEAALPNIQRRLARSLRDGVVTSSRSGRQRPLRPRVILVFERSPREEGLPPALDESLADVLEGWTLAVPALRDRLQDLPELIEARFEQAGLPPGRAPLLSTAALNSLRRHAWDRNEEELDTVLGRLATEHAGREVSHEEAEALLQRGATGEASPVSARELEKRQIVDALWRNGFHRGRTAQALNVSRKTLYNKMSRFGLLD